MNILEDKKLDFLEERQIEISVRLSWEILVKIRKYRGKGSSIASPIVYLLILGLFIFSKRKTHLKLNCFYLSKPQPTTIVNITFSEYVLTKYFIIYPMYKNLPPEETYTIFCFHFAEL